jgi:hypothetical protein
VIFTFKAMGAFIIFGHGLHCQSLVMHSSNTEQEAALDNIFSVRLKKWESNARKGSFAMKSARKMTTKQINDELDVVAQIWRDRHDMAVAERLDELEEELIRRAFEPLRVRGSWHETSISCRNRRRLHRNGRRSIYRSRDTRTR